MNDSALVIQADLPTVLAVTGLVLVAAVLAGIIRRAQSMRRVRRIERLVAQSVLDVLDGRCRHGEHQAPRSERVAGGARQGTTEPEGDQATALSSTDTACNWLVVLCLLGLVAGLVGGSDHLVWASGLGFLLIPLAVAPWLTRRQKARGDKSHRRGWSGFDSWWRYLGVGR